MMRTSIMIVLAAVSHICLAQTPDASKSVCDPGLTGSPTSSMGYSMRGDRCEGLYALQVNSTDLRLASLVESFELDSQNNAPLTVAWPPTLGGAGPVRLRAQSLRPRSYYRMDTSIDGPASSYAWPTEVLGTVDLTRDEVGVLGWFEREGREVYLPLRISQGTAAASSADYETTLMPSIRLHEVTITLTPVGPQGAEGQPVIDKKPLEQGYYPAKQATVFNLSKPDAPGLYKLDLVCDLIPTGTATATFWLYHAE